MLREPQSHKPEQEGKRPSQELTCRSAQRRIEVAPGASMNWLKLGSEWSLSSFLRWERVWADVCVCMCMFVFVRVYSFVTSEGEADLN